VLKGDSGLVVSAAAQAQRAADFIRGIDHTNSAQNHGLAA
jgi:hypothetical protein